LVDRDSFIVTAAARRVIRTMLPSESGVPSLASPEYLPQVAFAFSVFPSAWLAEAIARSWERAGDDAKATAWYATTLSMDADNRNALLSAGIALHREGRFAASVPYFMRVVQRHPNDLEAWFHLGLAYQHSGDVQQAANHYDRCLAIDTRYARARINLASLHHQYGVLVDAFVHYEVLLQQYEEVHRAASASAGGPVAPVTEYCMVQLNFIVALLQDGRHAQVHAFARCTSVLTFSHVFTYLLSGRRAGGGRGHAPRDAAAGGRGDRPHVRHVRAVRAVRAVAPRHRRRGVAPHQHPTQRVRLAPPGGVHLRAPLPSPPGAFLAFPAEWLSWVVLPRGVLLCFSGHCAGAGGHVPPAV
jgi:hypothetical protein